MPFFSRRPNTHTASVGTTRRRQGGLSGLFGRKDRDRVAGGYKGALSNPNTTRAGRKRAKRELQAMGRGNATHVPLMTKIKRALGIRSTPRRTRAARTNGRRTLL